MASTVKLRPPFPNVPPLIPWTLGTVGAWLIYTSVRGLSPLAEVRAALTGEPSPGRTAGSRPATATLTGANVAGAQGAPATVPAATAGTVPTLVTIGQGGHRLAPDAAAALNRWAAAFGAPILITDSYRDYATQAEGHAKDPGRFADPSKSAHPKGRAVDVNLGAVGAQAPGRGLSDNTGNATWRRLYSSAVATGWCNPRGATRGDGKEPWHFSFGGCA